MEAYKKRMAIEYRELKERTDKLEKMLDKWDKGTLDFEPTCSWWLLENQLEVMKNYVEILQIRAKIEDIDLTEADNTKTIDSAPVAHAHWVPDESETGEDSNTYKCSACGQIQILIDGTPKENGWAYCPNCGAKMDNARHEEEGR
jgi:DNA-directed RNA polymerase subunit RPC12/RpoP